MIPQEMAPRQRIAATAWGEARGEGKVGEEAAIATAINRAKIARRYVERKGSPHPNYGDGTIDVACIAHCDATYPQYDCWQKTDPNRVKVEALDFDHPDDVLDICLKVADEALDGTLVDITNGSTHYKRTDTPWPKSWGPVQTARKVIGHHSFYQVP